MEHDKTFSPRQSKICSAYWQAIVVRRALGDDETPRVIHEFAPDATDAEIDIAHEWFRWRRIASG